MLSSKAQLNATGHVFSTWKGALCADDGSKHDDEHASAHIKGSSDLGEYLETTPSQASQLFSPSTALAFFVRLLSLLLVLVLVLLAIVLDVLIARVVVFSLSLLHRRAQFGLVLEKIADDSSK